MIIHLNLSSVDALHLTHTFKKHSLLIEIFFSFGHMNLPEKRDQATKADLARATLVTVLNNIGSISMMCARTEVCNIPISISNNLFFIYRMLIEYYLVEVFYVLMIYQCVY